MQVTERAKVFEAVYLVELGGGWGTNQIALGMELTVASDATISGHIRAGERVRAGAQKECRAAHERVSCKPQS